jgi:hypothetical protein
MESQVNPTAFVIVLTLALVMFFSVGFILMRVADSSPQIHCYGHIPLTCTPETGKAN